MLRLAVLATSLLFLLLPAAASSPWLPPASLAPRLHIDGVPVVDAPFEVVANVTGLQAFSGELYWEAPASVRFEPASWLLELEEGAHATLRFRATVAAPGFWQAELRARERPFAIAPLHDSVYAFSGSDPGASALQPFLLGDVPTEYALSATTVNKTHVLVEFREGVGAEWASHAQMSSSILRWRSENGVGVERVVLWSWQGSGAEPQGAVVNVPLREGENLTLDTALAWSFRFAGPDADIEHERSSCTPGLLLARTPFGVTATRGACLHGQEGGDWTESRPTEVAWELVGPAAEATPRLDARTDAPDARDITSRERDASSQGVAAGAAALVLGAVASLFSRRARQT